MRSHTARTHDAAAATSATGPMALIDSLLQEAACTGVDRLHVEIEGDCCRVRLRRPDGLQTRRYEDARLVDEALLLLRDGASHVGDLPVRQTIALENGTIARLTMSRVATVNGSSWLLRLLPGDERLPLLDELISNDEVRGELRAALMQGQGLILLSGDSDDRLPVLANAIAADCLSPERKVLRLEAITTHALPGAVQVSIASLEPDRIVATCRSLLAHDADVIVADAALPQSIGPLLDALAAHRLVIRSAPIPDFRQVLSTLRGNGANGPWLAEHLSLTVRQEQLQYLCPRCRISDSRPDPASAGTDGSFAHRLLAQTLAATATASGCDACFHTGIGRVERFIDTCRPSVLIRQLLREDDFEEATRAMADRRRLPAIAHELARTGAVSMQEAVRTNR